jgi:putative membrane protein
MPDGMIGNGRGLGILLGMVFWRSLIMSFGFLAVWAVQRATGGGSSKTEESALEVLKKRYVRDEISKEEFEEKKRDIL